jgi:hypothetical protein
MKLNTLLVILTIAVCSVALAIGGFIIKGQGQILQALESNQRELGRIKSFYPEGFTTATSGQMTITADAQILATSTTKRLYAVVCNDSANVVYLSINEDAAAVANLGIRLNANGGCWEMLATENPYDGAIRAVASSASALTVTASDF